MKMKTQKICLIVLLTLLTFIISACENESTNPEEKATITISKPTENSIYNFGDTIIINTVIKGVAELHGYEVTIKNLRNDSVVYSIDEHTHGTKFDISKQWINDLNETANLELIVTAELDHSGNVLTKKVKFQTNKKANDTEKLEGGLGGNYGIAIFPKHDGLGVGSRVFIKFAANKAPNDTTGYDAKDNTMIEPGYGPHVHFDKLKIGTYFVFAKALNSNMVASKVIQILPNSPKSQDIDIELMH
jgi:hypothetical protein